MDTASCFVIWLAMSSAIACVEGGGGEAPPGPGVPPLGPGVGNAMVAGNAIVTLLGM